jgi:hypothetical protein
MYHGYRVGRWQGRQSTGYIPGTQEGKVIKMVGLTMLQEKGLV